MNTLIKNGREASNVSEKNHDTEYPSQNAVTNALFVNVVTENYATYIKKCYGYLKCTSLAEDAVQEGILAAHGSLKSLKNNQAINAWINKIITRKAIDLLRKNRNFLSLDDDTKDLVSYDKNGFLNSPFWAEFDNVENEILKKEGLAIIKQSLNTLSDTYRIPLLLKDYEDFSIKDISDILHISQSNVKVRIHRARIKLKTELGGYFFPEQTKGFL